MRRFFIAAATGFSLGYLAIRTVEAAREVRSPAPPLEKDAARYGRERRSLMLANLIRATASAATTAFVIAPFVARRVGSSPAWRNAAAYTAAATMAQGILELPIDFTESYVVERRYGMSEQNVRSWLVDRAKMTLVGTIVGAPLTGGLALLASRTSAWASIAGGAVAPLMILANLIVPVYVAPLFNTFVPLEGPLEVRLRALAARFGVGDAEIMRVDMSKQTNKANAYVTGLFGTHRIVVGDTLADHFSEDEITFVVAHELGHYVARDVWASVGLGSLFGFVVIVASARLAASAEDADGSIPALLRFTYFSMLLGTLSGPLLATVSRAIERRADRFAIGATAAPQWGVDAFTRLRDRNLAEDEAPGWYETLFASHPSLGSRIAALAALT